MNYLPYFRLREAPFGITPDTTFFYPCRSSQEALNTVLVALGNGEGFIKITGEVGTGKTLLCRKLLGTLKEGWVTAYIANPALEPRTLMLAFADELGMTGESGADQHKLLKAITRKLLDFARARRRVVLCMDEAQALPLETLEAVRLLTNLETEKRKLLQVVLFGQPELDRKLASQSIRQLRQRITFEHRLEAFAPDEVGAYVAHRLSVAGYVGPALFSAAALRRVSRASRGVPRLINVIANKALLVVYGEGGRVVEERHVDAAVLDTPSAQRGGRWSWLRFWARAA